MITDPACGMKVDEKSAAGKVMHSGKTYYFCSSRCQHEFEADPTKYAESGEVASQVSPIMIGRSARN